MYRRISALAVAALVFALFACTASSPSPPPSSQPPLPHTCTPTAPGPATAPYPCTSEKYRKQQERDALEAEAIAIYKRFSVEYYRLSWAGGSETTTPELEATLADPMKKNILFFLSDQKTAGITFQGPAPRVSVKVDRHSEKNGSLISLTTCEDYRGAASYNAEGQKTRDLPVFVATNFLKQFDGALKVFEATNQEANSCPI